MIVNGTSQVKALYQLIPNKRIIKNVHEIYMRSDIQCGIDVCTKCTDPALQSTQIYIIDHSLLTHHYDALMLFQSFRNFILLQSAIKKYSKEYAYYHREPNKYKAFLDNLEETQRPYFIFNNEHCEEAYVSF